MPQAETPQHNGPLYDPNYPIEDDGLGLPDFVEDGLAIDQPIVVHQPLKQNEVQPTSPELVPQTLGHVAIGDAPQRSAPRRAAIQEKSEQGPRFVREAPTFAEQLQDTSRTNSFRYVAVERALENQDYHDGDHQVTMTEHEGLAELHRFLQDFIEKMPADNRLVTQAHSMIEDLTFIGQKEYDEAAEGLGATWKEFLDQDPQNQLCVPLAVSSKYHKRKSDSYLLDNILSTFSDEELERYKGRILTDPKQLSVAPENARIILLDDWTISETQLADSYFWMEKRGLIGEYRNSIEVNLMVASERQLQNGLSTDKLKGGTPRVPIKSYFKSRKVEGAGYSSEGHITGIHSSVDYAFEAPISFMVKELNRLPGAKESVKMPPLTNIVREYRFTKPAVEIKSSGEIVRA